MKLYSLGASPNTIKVAAVIHTLNLPVEIIEVDRQKGDHLSPEYIKMNPNGRMPLLVDGDFHLWESSAIMIYLAQQKPESGLYPGDPKGQADVNRWIFWGSAHLHEAGRVFMYERLVKPMFMQQPSDEEAIKRAEPEFHKFAQILENHLETHKFVHGDQLTVADFALAAPFVYAVPAGMPWGQYAKIQAWFQSVAGTAAFQKAVPPMPVGAK